MGTKKTKRAVKIKARAKRGAMPEMTPALAKAIKAWATLKRQDPSEGGSLKLSGTAGAIVSFAKQLRTDKSITGHDGALLRCKTIVAILRAVDAIAKAGA